ncbi:MAG: hypothetical protein OSJ52_11350, partial [Lachnospiraceae bacterium]|nr:hypothetical protein [Lachnospiraceae bacterium]
SREAAVQMEKQSVNDYEEEHFFFIVIFCRINLAAKIKHRGRKNNKKGCKNRRLQTGGQMA